MTAKTVSYSAALAPSSFSVSTTGHRSLSTKVDPSALQSLIEKLLLHIGAQCQKHDPDIELRLLSALAAGADQIAAAAAVDTASVDTAAGSTGEEQLVNQLWKLHVILPFDRASYRNTLHDGMTHYTQPSMSYDELLPHAERVFELADRSAHVIIDKDEYAAYWKTVRFQTLGEILVRQADLLIAVWDGKVANGKGGTADVVSTALTQEKTVIRINPDTLEVSCLQATENSKSLITLVQSPAWGPSCNPDGLFVDDGEIDKLIEKLLVFPAFKAVKKPDASTQHNHDEDDGKELVFESARAYFGQYPKEAAELSEDATNTNALFHEDIPLRWLWNFSWPRKLLAGQTYPEKTNRQTYAIVYQWFANRLIGKKSKPTDSSEISDQTQNAPKQGVALKVDYASEDWLKPVPQSAWDTVYEPMPGQDAETPPTTLSEPVYPRPDFLADAEKNVRPHMVTADAIATSRGHAYRSSYVLNFLGGAFAVCLGLVGLFFEKKHYFVAAEVIALGLLIVIYIYAYQKCWHKRWLNARQIAETLRAGRFLAWLGYAGRRSLKADAPWTAWHTNMVMAEASVPDATISTPDIRYMALELRAYVADQIGYHKPNSERLRNMHHRLDTWGKLCVFAAIFVAIFYLAFFYYFDCFNAQFCDYPKGSPTWQVVFAKYFVTTFCAGAPVLAGAFMGIRFQGDYERFADRSNETQLELSRIDRRLENLLIDIDTAKIDTNSTAMPAFERFSIIVFDLLEIYELDVEDWRFVYAARPIPEVG